LSGQIPAPPFLFGSYTSADPRLTFSVAVNGLTDPRAIA
jgi:hypothetical protein